jgi:hypothetical protein
MKTAQAHNAQLTGAIDAALEEIQRLVVAQTPRWTIKSFHEAANKIHPDSCVQVETMYDGGVTYWVFNRSSKKSGYSRSSVEAALADLVTQLEGGQEDIAL